jgi:hypothetical protein
MKAKWNRHHIQRILTEMDDLDPDDILADLKGQTIGGVRKFCSDHKRCDLGTICEFAQHRGESVEVVALWDGKKDSCENYNPRREICDESNLFRSKTPRHNKLRGKNLIDIKQPDLMVSRHIKDGRNIKDN